MRELASIYSNASAIAIVSGKCFRIAIDASNNESKCFGATEILFTRRVEYSRTQN